MSNLRIDRLTRTVLVAVALAAIVALALLPDPAHASPRTSTTPLADDGLAWLVLAVIAAAGTAAALLAVIEIQRDDTQADRDALANVPPTR